jgi:hypothetical protein
MTAAKAQRANIKENLNSTSAELISFAERWITDEPEAKQRGALTPFLTRVSSHFASSKMREFFRIDQWRNG